MKQSDPTKESGRPTRPSQIAPGSSLATNMEYAHPGTRAYLTALERYTDALEAERDALRAALEDWQRHFSQAESYPELGLLQSRTAALLVGKRPE